MIIGAISLVFKDNDRYDQILGIDCAKGRGFILPGGKWERGELFEQTALRELREETNLKGFSPELIFHAMSPDMAYCYAFRVMADSDNYKLIRGSSEGDARWGSWGELLRSDFAPYYSLLRERT